MNRAFVVLGLLLALVLPAGAAKKAKPKAEPAPAAEPAPVCVPVEPLFDQLKASGLEYEHITDVAAVRRFAGFIKGSAPFPEPTSIVVAFKGDAAAIGIIVGDKLCAVLRGPADNVRRLVRSIQGQSVSAI